MALSNLSCCWWDGEIFSEPIEFDSETSNDIDLIKTGYRMTEPAVVKIGLQHNDPDSEQFEKVKREALIIYLLVKLE